MSAMNAPAAAITQSPMRIIEFCSAVRRPPRRRLRQNVPAERMRPSTVYSSPGLLVAGCQSSSCVPCRPPFMPRAYAALARRGLRPCTPPPHRALCALVGYDLHITRAEDWAEAADTPIAFAEWTTYAQSDARLSASGTIALRNHDPHEQPVYVLSHADGPSIHWYQGDLVVTGASDADVEQLRPIADALDARVQGDDGEFY